MSLSSELHQKLCRALVGAVRDRDELKQIVRFSFDQNLDVIVSRASLDDEVFELVDWAVKRNRHRELLAGALEKVPGNAGLMDMALLLANADARPPMINHPPQENIRVRNRLPPTQADPIGRTKELELLQQAWTDVDCRLVVVDAGPGTGKTTLLNEWITRLQLDSSATRPEAVFAWSFYGQGSTAPEGSANEAIGEALEFFQVPVTAGSNEWSLAEALLSCLQSRPVLLVLDGLEPLQQVGGPEKGMIRHRPLQQLVGNLVNSKVCNGMCVITTRIRGGLPTREQVVMHLELDPISPEAGAELLRRLGVSGDLTALTEIAEKFGGIPLALRLLAGALKMHSHGDHRVWREYPLLESDSEDRRHVWRVLRFYPDRLRKPLTSVLEIIGLFDRRAEARALSAVRSVNIPKLTDHPDVAANEAWPGLLEELREHGLLLPSVADAPADVEAHPLVREFFADWLRERDKAAWLAGNRVLYSFYSNLAPAVPTQRSDLNYLYTAIGHGCQAGLHQQVLDDIYLKRVLQNERAFSIHKMGCLSDDLAALAQFVQLPGWVPVPHLTQQGQTIIMHLAGFILHAVGRLQEAERPIRRALDTRVKERDWRKAAISAGHLSYFYMSTGHLSDARRFATDSVDYAKSSYDPYQEAFSRGNLAFILQQLGEHKAAVGELEAAEFLLGQRSASQPSVFGRALLMLRMLQRALIMWRVRSDLPYLYALYHFWYTELLVEAGRARDAEKQLIVAEGRIRGDGAERAVLTLCAARVKLIVDDPSSDNAKRLLARLDGAVRELRASGIQEFLVRGLLLRARARRMAGRLTDASSDLDEVRGMVELCGMSLHAADCHLELARLYVDLGRIHDAKSQMEAARTIIAAAGYQRRAPDLADLDRRINAE